MHNQYDDAVSITRNIHWVGFYDEQAHLHCNPYLLLDEDEVVFIDPGSIPHFPIVMRKVIDLVNPADISVIIASHQDPDVCSNLPVVEDVIGRPDLKIVAHGNTMRLIHHYGISSNRYNVEEHEFELVLKSGRLLQFIHTPYLHSPGAIMTYDGSSKSLFTSDVFGALSNQWSLFAKDNYLEAMKSWHQRYMPSNAILSKCLTRIEKLTIDRILPQHGSVLEGKQVHEAINYLKELPCGIDCEFENEKFKVECP